MSYRDGLGRTLAGEAMEDQPNGRDLAIAVASGLIPIVSWWCWFGNIHRTSIYSVSPAILSLIVASYATSELNLGVMGWRRKAAIAFLVGVGISLALTPIAYVLLLIRAWDRLENPTL
jgi:hypothetical protein